MGRGGIDSLLNVSRSSLFAQTQAIRVISDNIANVNTPGYSRRRADLTSQATSGAANLSVGTGVDVQRVTRISDRFVNAQLFSRVSERSDSQVRSELLSRAEAPFKVDGTGTIGTYLSEFFSALEDLTTSPSDIGLRQNVIERGANLTGSISETFSSLANLQREADDRLNVLTTSLNRLTTDIAEINSQIQTSEISDQEALALRDNRDQLVKELSELVEVDTLETEDGTIRVTLANGFALVDSSGSRSLEFSPDPSFAPVGGYPPGLDGRALGHIVFDFDATAGESHVDLTHVIRAGTGELAGLLKFRGTQQDTDTDAFDAQGDVVTIATRVEAIARDLIVRFNQTYQGPDETAGGAWQSSSGDLNGGTPGAYGLFSFAGAADTNADGRASMADLNTLGLTSYASILDFNVTDPESLAAALDLDPAGGATTFAPGDAANIEALLAQRDVPQDFSVYGLGNLPTLTIKQMYETTVTTTGSLAASAKNSFDAASAREQQVEAIQASVSGVSLDEEFANLINFQRAYEGSARMIRVADELLGELVNLLN